VISDDLIQTNVAGGIRIAYAPGTIVTSSTIGGAGSLGNPFIGVQVSFSANVSIQGSTVSGNSLGGILLNVSPDAVVSDDLIQSNTGPGIELESSSDSSITSSTIGGTAAGQGNGGIGISVVGSFRRDHRRHDGRHRRPGRGQHGRRR